MKYFAPRVGNRLTFYLQIGAMDAYLRLFLHILLFID